MHAARRDDDGAVLLVVFVARRSLVVSVFSSLLPRQLLSHTVEDPSLLLLQNVTHHIVDLDIQDLPATYYSCSRHMQRVRSRVSFARHKADRSLSSSTVVLVVCRRLLQKVTEGEWIIDDN